MEFIPVRTRALLPPKDDLFDVFDTHLPKLKNGDVLFITSKVLAIHQGCCIKINSKNNKEDAVVKEADAFIPPSKVPNGNFYLTIKDYTLIPNAGIDESNGNGYYILWPKNTVMLLKQIRERLIKQHRLKKLAVIATDSHTIPLRYGVIGISTGFCGIEPLYDYRGKEDIFGRTLKYTRANIVDSLSAMAVLLMGEGKEQVPIVIGRGIPGLVFTDRSTYKKLVIPPAQDIYSPLLKQFRKRG